ncbi:hypothetical protein [Streptomyces sp. NPDC047028]|uniref:hypothetical protein n=1 Tax=Streptomyces sp. NPDC047028 TaxID=3155793 RepID=UPI0033F69B4F
MDIRRKLTGKTSCDTLRDRAYRQLLYQVVLDTAPALRPVVTESGHGHLTPEQADAMTEAITSQAPRLGIAGDSVLALKAAFTRYRQQQPSGGRVRYFSDFLHLIYPIVWRDSAEPRVLGDPDACDQVILGLLHDDPDQAPPSFSALLRLFADPRAVAQLQDVIDQSWDPGTPGSPAPRPELVTELLDQPEGSTEWQKLWDAYTATRPWTAHLTRVNLLGLSRSPAPPRPSAQEPRTARGTSSDATADPSGSDATADPDGADATTDPDGSGGRRLVPPLDRSVFLRMAPSLKLLQKRPEVQRLTTRRLAQDEAHRATAPLGIGDDCLRAVLCLGAVSAGALSADFTSRSRSGGRPGGMPRRLRQLARVAASRAFVQETLRLGDAQHGPVREALADPGPGFGRALWSILHRYELSQRQPPPPEARWNLLVMSAARTFIDGLAGQIKDVMRGTEDHEAPDFDTDIDPLEIADRGTSGAGAVQEIVVDAVVRHLAEARLTADDALSFLRRFTDPGEAELSAETWRTLYANYRAPDADARPVPGALPAIGWQQARDIVSAFLVSTFPDSDGPGRAHS